VSAVTYHPWGTGPMKSERERMDIVSAYEQVGTSGGAELCGTTHKTEEGD